MSELPPIEITAGHVSEQFGKHVGAMKHFYLTNGLEAPRGISLPMRTFDTLQAYLKIHVNMAHTAEELKQVAEFIYMGIPFFRGKK